VRGYRVNIRSDEPIGGNEMMAADHNELEGGSGMKHEAAQLNKRQ